MPPPKRPFTTSSLTSTLKSTIAGQPLLSNLTNIDKLSSQASSLAHKTPFFGSHQTEQHQSTTEQQNASNMSRAGSAQANQQQQTSRQPAMQPSAPSVDLSHLTEEERMMIQSVMAKAQMAEMGLPVDTSVPSSTNLPSSTSQALSAQSLQVRQQQQQNRQQQQQQQQQQQTQVNQKSQEFAQQSQQMQNQMQQQQQLQLVNQDNSQMHNQQMMLMMNQQQQQLNSRNMQNHQSSEIELRSLPVASLEQQTQQLVSQINSQFNLGPQNQQQQQQQQPTQIVNSNQQAAQTQQQMQHFTDQQMQFQQQQQTSTLNNLDQSINLAGQAANQQLVNMKQQNLLEQQQQQPTFIQLQQQQQQQPQQPQLNSMQLDANLQLLQTNQNLPLDFMQMENTQLLREAQQQQLPFVRNIQVSDPNHYMSQATNLQQQLNQSSYLNRPQQDPRQFQMLNQRLDFADASMNQNEQSASQVYPQKAAFTELRSEIRFGADLHDAALSDQEYQQARSTRRANQNCLKRFDSADQSSSRSKQNLQQADRGLQVYDLAQQRTPSPLRASRQLPQPNLGPKVSERSKLNPRQSPVDGRQWSSERRKLKETSTDASSKANSSNRIKSGRARRGRNLKSRPTRYASEEEEEEVEDDEDEADEEDEDQTEEEKAVSEGKVKELPSADEQSFDEANERAKSSRKVKSSKQVKDADKSQDEAMRLLSELKLTEQANQMMEQQQLLIKQSQELIKLQLEQQALSTELKKSIKQQQHQQDANQVEELDNVVNLTVEGSEKKTLEEDQSATGRRSSLAEDRSKKSTSFCDNNDKPENDPRLKSTLSELDSDDLRWSSRKHRHRHLRDELLAAQSPTDTTDSDLEPISQRARQLQARASKGTQSKPIRRREPSGLPPSPLPVAAAIQLHQMQQHHQRTALRAREASSASVFSRSRSVTSSPNHHLDHHYSGYLTDSQHHQQHHRQRPSSPDTQSEFGGQRRRKRLPEPPSNAVPLTPSMVRKMIQAQRASSMSSKLAPNVGAQSISSSASLITQANNNSSTRIGFERPLAATSASSSLHAQSASQQLAKQTTLHAQNVNNSLNSNSSDLNKFLSSTYGNSILRNSSNISDVKETPELDKLISNLDDYYNLDNNKSRAANSSLLTSSQAYNYQPTASASKPNSVDSSSYLTAASKSSLLGRSSNDARLNPHLDYSSSAAFQHHQLSPARSSQLSQPYTSINRSSALSRYQPLTDRYRLSGASNEHWLTSNSSTSQFQPYRSSLTSHNYSANSSRLAASFDSSDSSYDYLSGLQSSTGGKFQVNSSTSGLNDSLRDPYRLEAYERPSSSSYLSRPYMSSQLGGYQHKSFDLDMRSGLSTSRAGYENRSRLHQFDASYDPTLGSSYGESMQMNQNFATTSSYQNDYNEPRSLSGWQTSSSQVPKTAPTNTLAHITKDDIINNGPKFNSIGYRYRTENQNKYVPQASTSIQSHQSRYPNPYKRILLSKNPKDRIGNGIGVRIVGGQHIPSLYDKVNRCIVTSGAFVTEVFQNSNVHFMGEMQEGDQIIEWNGVNLCNRSDEEVQQILLSQFSDDEVEIIYLRMENFNQVYDEVNKNDNNRLRSDQFSSRATRSDQFSDSQLVDSSRIVDERQFQNATTANTNQRSRRKLSLSSLSQMWPR